MKRGEVKSRCHRRKQRGEQATAQTRGNHPKIKVVAVLQLQESGRSQNLKAG